MCLRVCNLFVENDYLQYLLRIFGLKDGLEFYIMDRENQGKYKEFCNNGPPMVIQTSANSFCNEPTLTICSIFSSSSPGSRLSAPSPSCCSPSSLSAMESTSGTVTKLMFRTPSSLLRETPFLSRTSRTRLRSSIRRRSSLTVPVVSGSTRARSPVSSVLTAGTLMPSLRTLTVMMRLDSRT